MVISHKAGSKAFTRGREYWRVANLQMLRFVCLPVLYGHTAKQNASSLHRCVMTTPWRWAFFYPDSFLPWKNITNNFFLVRAPLREAGQDNTSRSLFLLRERPRGSSQQHLCMLQNNTKNVCVTPMCSPSPHNRRTVQPPPSRLLQETNTTPHLHTVVMVGHIKTINTTAVFIFSSNTGEKNTYICSCFSLLAKHPVRSP